MFVDDMQAIIDMVNSLSICEKEEFSEKDFNELIEWLKDRDWYEPVVKYDHVCMYTNGVPWVIIPTSVRYRKHWQWDMRDCFKKLSDYYGLGTLEKELPKQWREYAKECLAC